MRRVFGLGRAVVLGGQAAVVGVLCGLMVVPVGAETGAGARLPVEKHLKPLTEQERVLQALNRFTFGPRPGDVAAVERLGVERWFETQLHPERVDDSGFEAEMGEFPAMRLTAERLKERFPSGQEIRQMSKRGGSVPSDPVEGAIFADAEAVYQARLKKDAVASGVSGSVADPTRPQSARTDGAPGSFADGGRLRVVERRQGCEVNFRGGKGSRFRSGKIFGGSSTPQFARARQLCSGLQRFWFTEESRSLTYAQAGTGLLSLSSDQLESAGGEDESGQPTCCM